MFKKKHDVFIAYHGTYEDGSTFTTANKIYKYLTSKNLQCFFFPAEKNDSYKSNMIDVIQSRTFLFICNSNIHRDENGVLDRNYHYELSLETDAFYGAVQTGQDVIAKDAKVVAIGENWIKGDEEKLHPLFTGRTHIYQTDSDTFFMEIERWIRDRINDQFKNSEDITHSDITRTYINRSDMVSDLNLKRRIQNAQRVFAMGISNSELMSFDYDVFFDAINHGCKFKILFLDANCEATKQRELEEGIREGRIKKTTLSNLEIAEDIYDELSDDNKSLFEIRTYKRCPRINLLIVDEIAVLQYYDSFNRGMKNPSFLIEKKNDDNQLFGYCLSKFNEIISESEVYNFE